MIKPTESESKVKRRYLSCLHIINFLREVSSILIPMSAKLNRFCDALISIREEIAVTEEGNADINNNVLKELPIHHRFSWLTHGRDRIHVICSLPAQWLKAAKFWPSTGCVDNVYGDRNLICTLLPVRYDRWPKKRLLLLFEDNYEEKVTVQKPLKKINVVYF